MSDAGIKALIPLCPVPPPREGYKKSPVHMKNKVAAHAPRIAHSSGANSISPVPMRKSIKIAHGQLVAPAPGRLTPTGQGRIKAPPVCSDPVLKRGASSVGEFNSAGVCFPREEAERCAEKALSLNGTSGIGMEEMPLNIAESAESDADFPYSPTQFVSSNWTVVTTSSAGSCGRSAAGSLPKPPLDVVRTDLVVNNSEDEHPEATGADPTATASPKESQLATSPKRASSTASLSANFTDNLVKENSSRQGRSLQRWLVHSPTEELVRQVAGTIPITRDGRIILASASRKTEWILPKGGWDEDETREECAARETFEEAGLLGRLGGCLEPIDYETKKGRKRRLGNQKRKGEDEGWGPVSKRVKKDKAMETSSPSTGSTKTLESSSGSDASPVNKTTAPPPLTPAGPGLIDPKNHSYVRLFLFPLYVSSVKSDWPEKGRLRKLVDIDEAIEIMESENRLYFKRGLEMVKERGLHLLKP